MSDKRETPKHKAGWSYELLYQLVDNVKEYAIFVADPVGTIVSWNIGAERLFGYTADEAIGQNARIIFTPRDRERGTSEKEMATALREGCAEDERWHSRKDGSEFFASGVQTPLFDESGKHTGFAKIARDLTERIEAEEKLRDAYDRVEAKVHERTAELNEANEALQNEVREHQETELIRAALLHQIVRTQEEERKRISREIHDHIGQQITGLKLRLRALLDNKIADPELERQIAEIKAIANRIDEEVDFLAWELRPAELDELGLATAIAKFTDEWSRHFNIAAEFHPAGLDGKGLPPETEINLYRIVQEALNNIAKHANATNVSVLLEQLDGRLSLIIEDNGTGFEADPGSDPAGNGRGMGMMSMQERAEIIGGELEIESSPESGTTVYVRIPTE